MNFAQCSIETTTVSTSACSRQATEDYDHHPVMLPEELSKNVIVLTCESSAEGGVCDVYLLGTQHFSKKSREEAKTIVSLLKPEVVFLELCPDRRVLLTCENLEVPTGKAPIAALTKKKTMFEVLYGWDNAKISNRTGLFPGLEMRAAYEEAEKYGGRVVLGDRPIQITYRRIGSKLPFWHVTKMFFYCLFPPLQILRNNFGDLREIIKKLKSNGLFDRRVQFISKEFPTVTEILMDERDQYMSSKLLKIASESRSVVAVVGRGHLEGIKKYWKQPVAKDLMKVPYSKPGPAIILWKTLKYSLVLFLLRMTHHVTKNWSRRKLAGH